MIRFRLRNKALRARVIADHLAKLGQTRCLVYSCGNAARELRRVGLDVVEVGAAGALIAQRELDCEEMLLTHPGLFNATSGHLSPALMARLADVFRQWLPPKILGSSEPVWCPCGSGETMVALAASLGFRRLRAIISADIPAINFGMTPLAGVIAANVPVFDWRDISADIDRRRGWLVDTGFAE